jgi:hypothetical protein
MVYMLRSELNSHGERRKNGACEARMKETKNRLVDFQTVTVGSTLILSVRWAIDGRT